MKAAGVLILLATVAFSSVLPDSAAPQTLAKRTPRIPYEGLAIVVNANNPATDITLSQLRAMFLGERKWWSNRHRVVLAGMQRNTPEWHTVRRLTTRWTGGNWITTTYISRSRGKALLCQRPCRLPPT